MKTNMRVLLLCAIVGVAFGAKVCTDPDGDGTPTAMDCSGAWFLGDAAQGTRTDGSDCADQSGGCTKAECCGACEANAATCTDATTALTCDAGYGFGSDDCTLCTGTEFSLGALACANWANLVGACTGANYYTAGTNAADTSACTACTGSASTCDVNGALTCPAGEGRNSSLVCAACDGTTQFNAATDGTDCVDMTPACGDGFYESVALAANADRECAACNATGQDNIKTCSGPDTDNALSCDAGAGFASTACTDCTTGNFSDGTVDCAPHTVAPTCAGTSANTHWVAAGTLEADATCTDCTTVTGFTTCTSGTVAVTCAAGYEWATGGTCTECATGKFNAAAGVAACADWKAQCADGEVPLTGTTTADRGTCTACAGTNAATCDDADAILTCAVGWFFETPNCTACTVATETTNVVPTGWVVPENATGTAGTWGCAAALASGFSAWTCNTGFTINTAEDACTADADAAPAPAPGSASSAADTKSDESSAFIVGTAIAGIALLL